MRDVALAPVTPMPPPKKHTFKYQLPRLSSYEPAVIPEGFWAHWWKRPLGPAVLENVSWISPARLWDVAVAQGIPGGGRLRRVCDVLEFGADIGCVGRGRLPTRSANGDSLWQPEIGVVVADVLQDWVVKGVAAGPLTRR